MQKSLGSDDAVENMTSDICIDGTESIVDEVDGSSLVDSSRQINSLFLAAAQV